MKPESNGYDPQRAERFAQRLLEAMNSAALTLMTSIGHRTGLFDALSDTGPVTSQQLADRAGLNERYVREWLGAMATGGFVEHDPETSTFTLPAEHAALLTRKTPTDNLAVLAQYIPVLASVEDQVIECFRNGGGVPYEAYHRFHDVMAEDSGQSIRPILVDTVIPMMPGMRRRLENGIQVMDVGCGRGLSLMELASHFPRSRFIGYDLSQEAVRWADAEARRRGLSNIRFEQRDLSTFDADAPAEAYGLILALDAIHDQARPDRLLAGIFRALKGDGTFFMLDITGSCHVHKNMNHPIGPLVYTISCMHCMTVSLAQGGMGLGAMWGEETAERMLREAGFHSVEKHNLPHDVQNTYYVVRKRQAVERIAKAV